VKRIIVAFHIEQSLCEKLECDPDRWRVNMAGKSLRDREPAYWIGRSRTRILFGPVFVSDASWGRAL